MRKFDILSVSDTKQNRRVLWPVKQITRRKNAINREKTSPVMAAAGAL